MPLPAPQELRTYFITAVTANRRRLFQVEANAELLLKTIFDYRDQGRFQLHAFVVMPDHLHAILTPAPDVSLEKSMQYIKGGFSFRLESKLDVWSRSFNESQILAREKFDACKIYIEQNPVRAHLSESSETYKHSSRTQQRMIDPRPSHLRYPSSRNPSHRTTKVIEQRTQVIDQRKSSSEARSGGSRGLTCEACHRAKLDPEGAGAFRPLNRKPKRKGL